MYHIFHMGNHGNWKIVARETGISQGLPGFRTKRTKSGTMWTLGPK